MSNTSANNVNEILTGSIIQNPKPEMDLAIPNPNNTKSNNNSNNNNNKSNNNTAAPKDMLAAENSILSGIQLRDNSYNLSNAQHISHPNANLLAYLNSDTNSQDMQEGAKEELQLLELHNNGIGIDLDQSALQNSITQKSGEEETTPVNMNNNNNYQDFKYPNVEDLDVEELHLDSLLLLPTQEVCEIPMFTKTMNKHGQREPSYEIYKFKTYTILNSYHHNIITPVNYSKYFTFYNINNNFFYTNNLNYSILIYQYTVYLNLNHRNSTMGRKAPQPP
jgi:hypothetical protein